LIRKSVGISREKGKKIPTVGEELEFWNNKGLKQNKKQKSSKKMSDSRRPDASDCDMSKCCWDAVDYFRLYRGVELVNGMKILLISDPETDKAAAAMDVHIGT
jgi:hypothetical protein